MASKKSSGKKSSGNLVNVRIPASTAKDLLIALEAALHGGAALAVKGKGGGKDGGKDGGKNAGGGKGTGGKH
ncbi:MAG TPA: hypothetical protein VN181_00515 [Thermoanaerobaculia bacterium]|nr:hypothetical protein [Thermoanaerobaculia bacterium]